MQTSSGYRSDYDQYSQYHQQQMYPGYYSSWGFDQAGYPYSCQLYDYSQYPASQVGQPASQQAPAWRCSAHPPSLCLSRRARPFLTTALKVCTGSGLLAQLMTKVRCLPGGGVGVVGERVNTAVVVLQSPWWS